MNEDFIINPEYYLGYKSMVRYDNLSKIINSNYQGSNDDVIDLYIDLSSFISTLVYDNRNVKIEAKDNLFIAAWAINLCAHYRNFFKTRYYTYARIFLIYSDMTNNGSVYRNICQEYNKSGTHSYNITDSAWLNIINMNIELLRDMCKYIGNLEFIRTRWEFGTKTKYIINRNNSCYPIMIISNDIINSQLCDFKIYDNRFKLDIKLLVPSKFKKEDNSYLLTHQNTIYHYVNKYKKCSTVTPMFKSPTYIPMLMALSGYNKRSIKSIFSIRQSVNILNELYNDNIINDNGFSLFNTINNIIQKYPNKQMYANIISDRYKALSFNYQLGGLFVDEFDIDSYSNMTSLFNNQALYEIIDRLFKNYQIDIISL